MLVFSVGGRDGIIGFLLTDGHVHQTFGQTRELVNATSHEWMTNLFGVNLNTPNFAA